MALLWQLNSLTSFFLYLHFGGMCALEMKRGRANGHAFMTACPSQLNVVCLFICDVIRLWTLCVVLFSEVYLQDFCACVYKHKFVPACLHICSYVCLSISEFAYCGRLSDWQVLSFGYFGNLRKNNINTLARNHVWNIHTHTEMKWIFNIIYKPDYQHRVFVNVKHVVSWLTQIL